MTNNALLAASLDDILFEHRNKAYGAYALRKGYNARMLSALGAGMSVILLLAIFGMSRGNTNTILAGPEKQEGMVIRQVELPKEKPPVPEKPKEMEKQKPAEKIATVKYISHIKIEKDVKTTVASQSDLDGKQVGDKNTDGKKADGTVVLTPQPGPGTGNSAPEGRQADFTAQERSPEFPGGAEALRKFLARNLVSPGELEAGEMKTVRVRFKVDKDGEVNGFEIISSAGEDFDDEVVRVFRKMPRWIPALQNGINVPVNYVLPVTFVGSE
ncbi:MAG: TonB family protein [Sphingobacteriales bacterium]|nr:TonB family protein [Sphingobacteriales bacterium]